MGTTNLSKEEIDYVRKLAKRFSEKWTLEIVTTLNKSEMVGFNELIREIMGISAAVLSNRLKRLQNGGYVIRKVKSGPPTRTYYYLTEKGKNFIKLSHYVAQRRGAPVSETDEKYKNSLGGISL